MHLHYRAIAGCLCATAVPAAPRSPLLEAGVDGDDAAGEVLVARAREAGRLDHGLKLLLRRKLPDALHEVLVAVPVVGHRGAHRRDDVEGVGVIELAQAGHRDARKLQHKQPAAGAQHAVRLRQRGALVRHVADPKGDGVAVHGAVLVGQRLRVALHPGEVRARVAQPLRPPRALLQHRPVDVAHGHVRLRLEPRLAFAEARGVDDPERDVPRAARNVQVPHARKRPQLLHKAVLPHAVHPGAHQVVHDVVRLRHVGKDLAHEALLVAPGDGLKAKVHLLPLGPRESTRHRGLPS
mmetsp:Transcript_22263/g.57035  ORF Transcript_22263/g.57035 Transcript_22263/m.57035 type:complete len:295 (+) Transcript_22263:413-1297(+)